MAEKFKNLVDMFDQSAKKYASQQLFGTKRGGEWRWSTFAQVAKQVADLRGGLAALGIKAGDNVAVVANNREEWAVLAYACYGLGAALVPMYEAQNPKEWVFITEDCSAVALVAGSAKVLEGCKKVAEKVSSIKHVIGMELPETDDKSFAALMKKGAESPVAAIDPGPKDTACLIYTSGTTGNPKGVILSHGNIISNVNAVQNMLPIGPDDRSLSFLPWAHSFGHTAELHVMLSKGASIALAEAVDKIIANLSEVQPTILFSVPRIFNRVYDNVNKKMAERPAPIQALFHAAMRAANKRRRGQSPSLGETIAYPIAKSLVFSKVVALLGGRLKYAFSGGAALSRDVAEFIDNLGITVYEGYGLTETSPIATANRPGAHRIGSVGKAIEDVKIVIDKSQTSADAKDGEILIYGPNVMQGYYKRDDENKAAFTEDGGFRTGDLGYLDAEGFLYITGRLKELYKLQNGKYVAPAPLEEKIKLSPFIANCMVYGDNRVFNVALVVPDFPTLRPWAAEHGVSASSDQALSEDPKVQALMQAEVDKFAAEFKGFEEVKKVGVLPEDFTTENGMMTPSMKVKRRVVLEKYQDKIEALYK
ncbi:MAG: long-chain fatty acid--CoA ligase [Polyangiaceae bacterium]|nr:long-chain fatty acid--CoA ligase [Polyangiaceae bacterium]MBK8939271.1 long-chain fatty acid--CoA ligase [Polyangiaceae bacterium]